MMLLPKLGFEKLQPREGEEEEEEDEVVSASSAPTTVLTALAFIGCLSHAQKG